MLPEANLGWEASKTVIFPTGKLVVIRLLMQFEFVLSREATPAAGVRTLILSFRMPARNMPFKVGLSLEWSLVFASCYGATERGEVDVVNMGLKAPACLEENLAGASRKGTQTRPGI